MIIRHTQIGDYLLCEDSVLKIDEATKEIIAQCDGCHTVEEIVEWIVRKEKEPEEVVYKFDQSQE
ncbi:MAG: hypothetical protein PVF58_06020 [Candidatus Methanofastidiosia archaeon]